MEALINIARFAHILGVVFMSAPLYSLIVVNERGMLGDPKAYKVDRYMENIIKRQAKRCYIFQLTVLVSGIALVYLDDIGLVSIFTDWVLATKTGLLLVLMGLLSYVHLGIQPHIEKLLAQVEGDSMPEEVTSQIKPFRARRKKLAGFCLFIVITIIILGLQVFTRYNPFLTFTLIALAALFSFRVYKTPIRYGWV